MAEEQTGQERTEQPTARRLEQARSKGQVPRSRELNTMLSLMLAGAGLWFLGEPMITGLADVTRSGLSPDRALVFDHEQLPVHLMSLIMEALLALTPFLLVTVVAAFAGPLLMGGWSFSLEAMAFKLSKIDPVKGLGRLFSAKALLELVKTLVKFCLLLAVAYGLIQGLERQILTLSAIPPEAATERSVDMLLLALMTLSATTALIVSVDVPFELWNHTRQLRMTRQEIRDELKETEGRPEVRQRVRNLQREVSQRRMMEDVATADVVITNPTHVSVALSYANGSGAPTVVAVGRDRVALRIRELARASEVPLFEAPLLARALYAHTRIGDEIPEDLYMAVARVLAYLFQLRRSGPTDYVPRPATLAIPDHYTPLMDEEFDDGDD